MWNDVATKSPTKIGKRVWIVNSVARYDTYKRRIVLNVNELETIELNTCFVLCTHWLTAGASNHQGRGGRVPPNNLFGGGRPCLCPPQYLRVNISIFCCYSSTACVENWNEPSVNALQNWILLCLCQRCRKSTRHPCVDAACSRRQVSFRGRATDRTSSALISTSRPSHGRVMPVEWLHDRQLMT